MESRYALRELQGAIGHDCRRLEDGRRALFRHSFLHKRMRRDYYERRDAMLVLHASFMSVASLGSHARVDFAKAAEIVNNDRRMFIKVAFPYVDADEVAGTSTTEVDYDALFKELDDYIAAHPSKEADKGETTSPDSPSEAGSQVGVATRNDIMD